MIKIVELVRIENRINSLEKEMKEMRQSITDGDKLKDNKMIDGVAEKIMDRFPEKWEIIDAIRQAVDDRDPTPTEEIPKSDLAEKMAEWAVEEVYPRHLDERPRLLDILLPLFRKTVQDTERKVVEEMNKREQEGKEILEKIFEDAPPPPESSDGTLLVMADCLTREAIQKIYPVVLASKIRIYETLHPIFLKGLKEYKDLDIVWKNEMKVLCDLLSDILKIPKYGENGWPGWRECIDRLASRGTEDKNPNNTPIELRELITAVWDLQRRWHYHRCDIDKGPNDYKICDMVSGLARDLEKIQSSEPEG